MKIKTLLMGAIAATALAPAAFAERGSDGQVNIIYWQAPSILNPFLSGGTKDVEAASLVIEPLARYNSSGEMVPWLAEEIPTTSNGGVSEDLTSITWKLKKGIKWSDGSELTSADVKFTYEYCTHPEGGCAQVTKFEGVTSVETPDDYTVVVTFGAATPFPYGPFVGGESPILQKAQFEQCMGAKAPECTDANFGPIGTGPFVVEEFKPNDVITFVANDQYRDASKPAFSRVLFKGGGDATAAGRAVLETGEFDYAWNLQLAPDVISQMEAAGKGKAVAGFGPLVERLMLNNTNPSPDLGPDERSVVRPHPFLSDPAVYKAMSMAIDRELLVEIGYGKAGKVTCSWVPAPEAYAISPEGCNVQDVAGANAMLDEAGIVDTDGDGIREKDGVPLKVLYQTSTNAVRQDFQALIKQWWSEIGIDAELRNINASVFFGGDPGSPDTFQKFYADVEMYANTFNGTDPQSYFGNGLCDKAPTPASQWQGENISRFCDEEFDALHAELSGTADMAKRVEIGQKLNTIIFEKGGMIPLVHRGRLSAHANTLGGVDLNVWDSELWNIADWHRAE
ncbi:peptide ABC transporter substrate-binding protein [Phaeobacter italicus]|jgi:peptide/nickel transport system substrate-binding protein|uniref:Oligopeptide-binding protein AppA n=1 Tax=Phaeobacter italicus TaxID=481446 RepID=A0A0H5D3A5_9RHOB|nr:peptide ABC transporter substrate-binding protein [Phaeobacter italicus]EEB70354.1 extracellular solute-binding protein, family 5 [Ruegeria sp. R11]MEC8016671.1 peptide ABC transporter substrate-binding protein [Pseudomonadota bacterium]NKX71093.1 peptide ABC transporter substrate-binding protein [Rhodobacteraceae bacterium R_SAG1]MBO9442921.1 peptide ABC transporter substrate-binding protein [Phaeobacter italicus]MBY5975109.1 peptide ABC transporter substrate-binding protein [Phaeobacter i